jgi:hypothetical protein
MESSIPPISMLQVGQVWEIKIPYDDATKFESRPAVVVAWSDFLPNQNWVIWFVPVTSHGSGGSLKSDEISIKDLDSAGLTKSDSVIKARHVYSMSPTFLRSAGTYRGLIEAETLELVYGEIENVLTPKPMKTIPN